MKTRALGNIGENIAVEYLKRQDYKILQRNFHTRQGEIDIIAQDGEFVVFVEVKRRSTELFGLPRESINHYKQQTIVQCAQWWLTKNGKIGVPVRFDVVEILGDEVTLWKDAFRVPPYKHYKK